MQPLKYKCFTILELLIVVGIVMILSAIGMQNFLLANVRAKTSTVFSDLRAFATGIETYYTDSNTYPRMAHASFYGDPAFDFYENTPLSGTLSRSLSTPVAYVSEVFKGDPFVAGLDSVPLDEQLYTYQTIRVYIAEDSESIFWPAALEYYGEWRMCSVGPDQIFYQGFANSAQLPYDPTNGTLSPGNIWYSQMRKDGIPPVPALLGEH